MAGAFLAVGDEGWRVTITGDFNSGPLPTGYIDKLRRFEGAICAFCESDTECGDKRAEPIARIATEIAAALNEPEDEFVPWPTTGTVTSKEIAAAWVIGESTWKQKVRDGIYPEPLEVESMRKLWDVPTATKALTYSGVQRRRVRKIGAEEAE